MFGGTTKRDQGNRLLSDMVHTGLGRQGKQNNDMDFCLTNILVWEDEEDRLKKCFLSDMVYTGLEG